MGAKVQQYKHHSPRRVIHVLACVLDPPPYTLLMEAQADSCGLCCNCHLFSTLFPPDFLGVLMLLGL